MRLQNQVVLVTGGASGIGLAAVEACLVQGAQVVMADLATSSGQDVCTTLAGKYPNQCVFMPVDVTSTVDVDNLVANTVAHFGRLDAVFNNAGIGGITPAVDYLDEDFMRVIDVNLMGVFRVARAALRVMYAQGSGSIVNCASILGFFGQSGTAAYTAAKGGVVNMTRTLAIEAAAKGVRVNGIGPGYIKTPLLDALDEPTLQFLQGLHPLGRLGEASEVADAFVFLASQESSFITGHTLMVDGGFLAGKS